MLPESFRKYPMFDNIYELDTVPIATVQVYWTANQRATALDRPNSSHLHIIAAPSTCNRESWPNRFHRTRAYSPPACRARSPCSYASTDG
eukprot:scaffold53284_cov33-Tisochrysis_lutea.AAC.3